MIAFGLTQFFFESCYVFAQRVDNALVSLFSLARALQWSSMPIFTDAVREAAARPDWQKRLFLVPRAHVTRLQVSSGAVTGLELRVNGQPKFLSVSPKCAVVLASSTVEATRLAME